jgi:hypothetical protein
MTLNGNLYHKHFLVRGIVEIQTLIVYVSILKVVNSVQIIINKTIRKSHVTGHLT